VIKIRDIQRTISTDKAHVEMVKFLGHHAKITHIQTWSSQQETHRTRQFINNDSSNNFLETATG